MISDRLRELVIEAAEKMLRNPDYEFSDEEEMAISMLLAEQFEMQEPCFIDIGALTLH